MLSWSGISASVWSAAERDLSDVVTVYYTFDIRLGHFIDYINKQTLDFKFNTNLEMLWTYLPNNAIKISMQQLQAVFYERNTRP